MPEDCLYWADSHATNLDVVMRGQSSLAHLGDFLVDGVIDLAAELRVLVEVGKVRSLQVEPNIVLLGLFLLLALGLRSFIVVVLFSEEL